MYLFDLDGTLIDSNGIWTEVDRTFLSRRGFAYTQEYRDAMAHMIFPLGAQFTKEYCHLSESCEEIMAEWMDLAKDSYAHVPLKPHARELVDRLHHRGEKLAIFTSSVPAHCATALRVHGLTPYFEGRIVFASDLGINKSSPEAFLRACEILGERPEACILLDDSARSCAAAKAAGLKVYGVFDATFGIPREQLSAACDRVLHDLGELLAE